MQHVDVPAPAKADLAVFKSFTSDQLAPLYCSVIATSPGEAPPKARVAAFVPICAGA
jgi:hypothetical protein